MLTSDQRVLLQAPFHPDEHSARPIRGIGTWATVWAIWINPEAVVRRLREVVPHHSWEVRDLSLHSAGWTCTRRLTIIGEPISFFEDVGADADTSAEGAKKAATDAIRRTARLIECGLYVYDLKMDITTDQVVDRPASKDDRVRNDRLRDEAMGKYLAWFLPWSAQWYADHNLSCPWEHEVKQIATPKTAQAVRTAKPGFIDAEHAKAWYEALHKKYPKLTTTHVLAILQVKKISDWSRPVDHATGLVENWITDNHAEWKNE